MVQIRGARPEDLDAAATCVAAAFSDTPETFPQLKHAFQRSLRLDTQFAAANTRLVIREGRVASVLHIADRRMLIEGMPVRVGFVPWLGTYPEDQRRGYGALLLMDAAAYMAQAGYDLSLIPGEGLEHFYERAGWCNFQHFYYARIGLPNAINPPNFPGEIRPIDWTSDLDAVMAIHDQYNRDATGLSVWTRDFWSEYSQFWKDEVTSDYPLFYVAEVDGAVVAFLRNGFRQAILEIGLRRSAEAAALALVIHACRQAQLAGLPEVYAIDLGQFQAQLAAHNLHLQREKSSGYMYRIINLGSLVEKLLPRMQDRWTLSPAAEWEGSIHLDSQAGSVYLRVREGRVSIPPFDSEPSIRLRLTHAQTIDLLFGQADIPHLWIESSSIPTTTHDVLETLFPNREFRYYPKDAI